MKAKKTSIKHLDSVPRHTWEGPADLDVQERGLNTEHFEGEQFDFIFDPKPETGRLIVFFSGDARRTTFDRPYSSAGAGPPSSRPAACTSRPGALPPRQSRARPVRRQQPGRLPGAHSRDRGLSSEHCWHSVRTGLLLWVQRRRIRCAAARALLSGAPSDRDEPADGLVEVSR